MKSSFIVICICLFLLINQSSSTDKDYTDFVLHLKQKITQKPFKGIAYDRLAYLSDTYGPRMWGSDQLQTVIGLMKVYAEEQGFDNVRLQPVTNFTKWVRGKQQLTMLSPRAKPTKLDMIGLGGTIAGNITGQVFVVDSFDELQLRETQAKGKIVLFNQPWVSYKISGKYRIHGASIAASYGAIAMLVRSVASESVSSVHTGYMEYNPKYPKIPCAAVTVEDSEMFRRMQDRGQKIVVNLLLENQFIQGANSSNLVFQIKGSQKPDQILLAGGHIDSWDTGSQTGALDDGGGFITVYQAFRLLHRLGFRPRRTLRFIAWTGEQSGSPRDGAQQYMQRHINEVDKHVIAFENDRGCSKLIGFGHTGAGESIVRQIVSKYMSLLNAGNYSTDGGNADVEPLFQKGVPIVNNWVFDTPVRATYYRYHHTAGDSMTVMNSDDMDSNVVGIAAFLYIVGDLEKSIRDPQYNSAGNNLRLEKV